MTTVVGDFTNYDASYLTELAGGTLGAHSATQFVLTDQGYTVTVTGTGFTYSGNGPSAGTITGMSVLPVNSTQTTTWSSLSVSASSLWSAVKSANITTFDTLLYGGNDTFTATDFGAFSGFGGNDTFNMQTSTSTDFLSGGDGNDTFNYAGNFAPTTQIDGGTGTNTLNLDGNYTSYTSLGNVTNIQTINVTAGFNYNLEMSPTSGTVTFNGTGLGANDSLSVDAEHDASGSSVVVDGGAGNDTMVSGAGNDVFSGGGGSNTVDYSHATSGVTVDLTKTTAQAVGGGMGSDTLSSVQNVIGSFFGDTITGNSSDNTFILNSATGNVINGGGGSDTVSFQNIGTAVTIDLRSGSVAGNTFTNIENVEAGRGSTFIGNASNNTFTGLGLLVPGAPYTIADYEFATSAMTFNENADDSITATGGGQGTDTLIHMTKIEGSAFNDTFNLAENFGNLDIDGGSGTNAVTFANATSGISVSLNAGSGSDSFQNIQSVTGSSFDDHIIGDNGNNTLIGGAGNDTLAGGPSSDDQSNGNDTIIGGTGIDTAVYYGLAGDYTITHNANGSVTISGDMDGTDTLWGIEKLQFLDTTISISMANYPGTGPVQSDFNADGLSDTFYRNSSTGQDELLQSNGNGTFSTISQPTVGNNWTVAGTGDFNGDGQSDLLWRDSSGDNVIWTSNGNGTFAEAFTNPVPTTWTLAAVGDFTGDGKSDIFWRDGSGQDVLWTSNGDGTFAAAFVLTVPTTWSIAGVGDFNGDGKSDILWRNGTTGEDVIWTATGGGAFSLAFTGPVPLNWTMAGIGDFNGDGKSDIFWRDQSTGQDVIWTSNGDGTFNPAFTNTVATNWSIVQVGDFNGDGKSDILWRDTAGDTVIWQSNGDGTFNIFSTNGPSSAWSVAPTNGSTTGTGATLAAPSSSLAAPAPSLSLDVPLSLSAANQASPFANSAFGHFVKPHALTHFAAAA